MPPFVFSMMCFFTRRSRQIVRRAFFSPRGLFNADVQPTSAICRPVEACETAATQIAEDVKTKRAFFCAPFL